jgi:hypothetical protein
LFTGHLSNGMRWKTSQFAIPHGFWWKLTRTHELVICTFYECSIFTLVSGVKYEYNEQDTIKNKMIIKIFSIYQTYTKKCMHVCTFTTHTYLRFARGWTLKIYTIFWERSCLVYFDLVCSLHTRCTISCSPLAALGFCNVIMSFILPLSSSF